MAAPTRIRGRIVALRLMVATFSSCAVCIAFAGSSGDRVAAVGDDSLSLRTATRPWNSTEPTPSTRGRCCWSVVVYCDAPHFNDTVILVTAALAGVTSITRVDATITCGVAHRCSCTRGARGPPIQGSHDDLHFTSLPDRQSLSGTLIRIGHDPAVGWPLDNTPDRLRADLRRGHPEPRAPHSQHRDAGDPHALAQSVPRAAAAGRRCDVDPPYVSVVSSVNHIVGSHLTMRAAS